MSRHGTATVVLSVAAAALFSFVIGMIEGGFDSAQVVIVLLAATLVGRTLRAERNGNADLAAAPSPHDLHPLPVGGSLSGRPEYAGTARLIVKLDWLNEATIRRALSDGHLRRDIPASDIDAALPEVQAWLGKLDAAALTEGRRIIYSAYYFAVYGVLDVSIVTPDEYALWSEHPHWSYRRVQRVTRRRLRHGTGRWRVLP